MEIVINGEPRIVAQHATVDDVLSQLGIVRDGIAVALNDEVVPRSQYAEYTLEAGVRLEIVQAVAGG